MAITLYRSKSHLLLLGTLRFHTRGEGGGGGWAFVYVTERSECVRVCVVFVCVYACDTVARSSAGAVLNVKGHPTTVSSLPKRSTVAIMQRRTNVGKEP